MKMINRQDTQYMNGYIVSIDRYSLFNCYSQLTMRRGWDLGPITAPWAWCQHSWLDSGLLAPVRHPPRLCLLNIHGCLADTIRECSSPISDASFKYSVSHISSGTKCKVQINMPSSVILTSTSSSAIIPDDRLLIANAWASLSIRYNGSA